MEATGTDWDAAFDIAGSIPGAERYFDEWSASAAAYRDAAARFETDIPYGDGARETFDLVWPDAEPKGLAVFVHGGFWMRLSKSFWTHLAEGARWRGLAVAMPSYTLAPEARISEITRQIGRAITVAAGRVDGPIFLSGHSAGGHLVSRMVCADTPLPGEVAARIAHVTTISGLHDLRPLLGTVKNETLRLDADEAARESPALLRPAPTASVTAWVGGGELPEFIRQTELLKSAWSAEGVDVACEIDGAHHHFSVVDGLRDPDSRLCAVCFPV